MQKYSVDLSKRYHQVDRVNHYNLFNENDIIEKIERRNLNYYGYNMNSLKDHNFFFIPEHFWDLIDHVWRKEKKCLLLKR